MSLHWTALEIATLAIAAPFFAAWVLMQRAGRRDDRERAEADRAGMPLPDAPDEAFAALADEMEAGAYAAYAAAHPMTMRPGLVEPGGSDD